MKNNSLLKYVVLLSILLTLTNCSNEDTSLEIIDTPQSIEQVQTKNAINLNCNAQVIVEFTFSPGTPEWEQELFKYDYYMEKLNDFTICMRIAGDSDCPDKEKWIVNLEEYQLNPIPGTNALPTVTRSGNNTGAATEGGIDLGNYWSLEEDVPVGDPFYHCFDQGEVLSGSDDNDDQFDFGLGNGLGEDDNNGQNGLNGF